jgi:hypothetical protein
MRATIDGPATGRSTAIWGACDAAVQHRPRRAGRDPTIPEETSIARAPKPARTARNRPAPYGTVQDSTAAAAVAAALAAAVSLTRFQPLRRFTSRASQYRNPHETHSLFRGARRRGDEL